MQKKTGNDTRRSDSPLLANCYFRRFLMAWQQHGHQEQFDTYIVNYADDFVICCRRGLPTLKASDSWSWKWRDYAKHGKR